MPYDDVLADRVRRALASRRDIEEKRMFGGIAFMVAGRMACGLVGDTLMVRVGPDAYEVLLDAPHVRPMDFTGRPLKGFVYVEPEGIQTPRALRTWIQRALAFVDTQPVRTVRRRKAAGR
jgi:TfoX/Sxy family transcriptional regulator of competence genes